MNSRTPLIISIVLHVAAIILAYANFGRIFSPKIKDSGYAVFDFVEIGSKSKAPILSDTHGRLSKIKAKTPEDKAVRVEKKQLTESDKPEDSKKSETEKSSKEPPKEDKSDDAVVIDKKKPEKKKEKSKSKSEKKTASKSKTSKKSNSNEKAVVNLEKSKKKSNSDTKAVKKSFNSVLDGAMAEGEFENNGMKAEEVGDVLTATEVDLIRETIRKCWHFPAGLKNAETLVAHINMELDSDGNVIKAEVVEKERALAEPDFKIAVESAYRAVFDPNCRPLPLPKDKYEEWKNLTLTFDPKDMLG
ncbi:MAG: cell envelope integrity protein TolA [Holosporales bacterium]|nr:cell envelope integrity protein TolA [Holosporales bacterium]